MLSITSRTRNVLPTVSSQMARCSLVQRHQAEWKHALRMFSAQPSTSSSPSSPSSPSPSSRVRRRKMLDPIIVTDAAAQRLKEILDHNQDGAVGIRLGTKKRGCNGLSYTLNYVKEISDKDEPLTTSSGVQVFIEPMALMNVIGTTMDWVETELSAEFTFTNPNSKGECGCGESFNV